MKPVYSNIEPSADVHKAGVVQLLLAPREWLSEAFEIDFSTNKVIDPVTFIAGRSWLQTEFAGESITYNENERYSDAGRYYEIVAAGVLNYLDEDLLQLIETLRYHEFVVVLMDRKKKYRIAGTYDKGMLLTVNSTERAEDGGEKRVSFSFAGEQEQLPPFYDYISPSVS